MTKPHTLILALMMMTSVGCAAEKDASNTDSGGADTALNGAQPFSDSCAGCHGASGDGVGSNPSLVETVPELSDADLMDVIDNGKGGMPDVGLSDSEADAVFTYVREQFGEEGGG